MCFDKGILLTVAVCLLPLAGQARSVKSDPTLSTGGVTFSDFSCKVTEVHGGRPGSCGSIGVSTINWPADGLQFSGDFNANSNKYLSFDNTTLKYLVTSDSAINSISLDFDGTFYGEAISSVTETLYSNGHQVGFAEIACGTAIGCTRSNSITLDGSFKDLWVTENIDVASYLGVANIAFVNNTFESAIAPEPSSIALIGAGLLGVAALRRRRREEKPTA
jgi:hypothetical protein